MTRHEPEAACSGCASSSAPWWLAGLAALSLVLAGCNTTALQRAQSGDETETQHYGVEVVGDRTTVGNADAAPLGGVGLVEGLDGTGGDCPHDNYRAMLSDKLRKEGVRNVNELLKSPDCAVVIVEGFLMPGASKGDSLDIEVKLHPGSKATSLRGGRLRRCYLSHYDFAQRLRPDYNGGRNMLMGQQLAVASGPVLVGVGDGEDVLHLKNGRIWSGGRALQHMPLALLMNPDSQRAALTSTIAEKINSAFGATDPSSRIAQTADNMSVSLKVPPQYANNIPRFLRVVRAIPITEASDLAPDSPRRPYRQILAEDLKDPTRTIVAAVRLEALGPKSALPLREGLKSAHPLVRFASAESLAYLGNANGAEELASAAAEHPVLRSYALTALSSLNESVCQLKLRELLVGEHDEETRYGAFRALQVLNPEDSLISGEHLNSMFWLHRIAEKTRPFVHVSSSRRAEVVLFGETPMLKAPFSILAGEITVTAGERDILCTVTRFLPGAQTVQRQCGLEVESVLRTMAAQGAQYQEVLTVLQEADRCGHLSCRLRIDAMPRAVEVQELAGAANDVAAAASELSATPGLYLTNHPNLRR